MLGLLLYQFQLYSFVSQEGGNKGKSGYKNDFCLCLFVEDINFFPWGPGETIEKKHKNVWNFCL